MTRKTIAALFLACLAVASNAQQLVELPQPFSNTSEEKALYCTYVLNAMGSLSLEKYASRTAPLYQELALANHYILLMTATYESIDNMETSRRNLLQNYLMDNLSINEVESNSEVCFKEAESTWFLAVQSNPEKMVKISYRYYQEVATTLDYRLSTATKRLRVLRRR